VHSNSNRVSLLGSVVIYNYPEEKLTLSRKGHTRKDCCYIWTELNTHTGEIGRRSRSYQPEAFGPSDPGRIFLGLGTTTLNPKLFFFFSIFAQLPSPPCHVFISTCWRLSSRLLIDSIQARKDLEKDPSCVMGVICDWNGTGPISVRNDYGHPKDLEIGRMFLEMFIL